MKSTSISLFRQVLNLIPQRKFEEIIMEHGGDKHKQSFDSWGSFGVDALLSVGASGEFAGDLRRIEDLRRQTQPPRTGKRSGQIESFLCSMISGHVIKALPF